MGMSSQAKRFQKPDAHIRHSAARNHAKSKNRACAASILQTASYPISELHGKRSYPGMLASSPESQSC
jgi:hypothetical protein